MFLNDFSRSLAEDLWKQIGAQWEIENEDDLKDKMDFQIPARYASEGESMFTFSTKCKSGCSINIRYYNPKLHPQIYLRHSFF